MQLEDVKPAHCHVRALRALGEIALVRDAMGRSPDGRPAPEISGAAPREVYFEALAFERKVARLCREVGVAPGALSSPTPPLTELKPGHVLRRIDAAIERIEQVKARLGVTAAAPAPTLDEGAKPTDVLIAVVRCNRELSRALEKPFTPEDVFRQVALASSYASQLVAAKKGAVAPAGFEPGRRPADCYDRLEACLDAAGKLITAAGHTALAERSAPPDVLPGDVYDLASLVLGELAFLHAITPGVAPVHPFDPPWEGQRLPAHVHQLARTLEAQLAALA
jgi:hypothetical protein